MRHALAPGIALSLALALSACAIGPSDFHATDDAAPASDALPDALAPLAIVLSAPSLTVAEGQSGSFNVHLNRAPGASVTIQVAPTTPTDKVGLPAPELMFDDSNFGTDQAVSVTGTTDVDTLDETVELTLTAIGVTGVTPATITITVQDPDKVTIVTDVAVTNIIQVDENGTVDVRMHLSAKPAGDVRIDAILGTGPVFIDPTTRTFTPQNYDADQTFTISTPLDANTISEDESLTFRGTSGPAVADKLYTVHVVDKDVLNISAQPASLIVNEEGPGGALQVALTQDPVTPVTVTLTTVGTAAHLDKTSLMFTTGDWATAQTVTVTGNADPDTHDDADTINLHANVSGVVDRSVGVTIHDNDTPTIMENAPATVTVGENATTTFEVWLKYDPTTPVTVNVASLAGAVATVTPGTLDFDSTNYGTHRTVTIKGTDDLNLISNSTTVRLSEPSMSTIDIPVTVTDDDTQVITLSKTTSSIVEPGTDTFTAALGFDPGGTVNLTVASNDVGVDVFPTTLTFNSTNYMTAKSVTISAVDDADANSIDTTVDVAGGGAATKSVAVHVTDNDTVALVLDQTGIVSIPEGGGVDVKVHLAAKPNGNVTVTPQIAPGTVITVSPTSQTFSPGAYATDLVFHFAAGQDGNATSEDIPVTFHPNVAGIADVGITLRTIDDDVLGIAVVTTPITLIEQGAPATVNVALSAMPAGTVTVAVSSSTGDVAVNKAQLIFDASNWATAQPVVLSAPMDANTLPGASVVSFSATTLMTRTINVSVTDDDTQAIANDAAAPLAVTEGSTTTFQVWLAFDPVTPVTVTVASLDASLAAPATGSTSFVFDSSNYSTKRTVTINGVQDQNLASGATTIRLTAPGIATVNLPINVADDDTQLLVVTAPSVSVPEGSSVQFDVSLKFDPGSTVNVGVASGNSTALPVSPTSIQFSSANYSSPVHVTVSAPADPNLTSESTNLTISGAGAANVNVAAQVVDSTVEAFPGWPTYFGQTVSVGTGFVNSYKVHIDAANLDYFGIYGTAGFNFRMALYDDNNNAPGNLVAAAQMAAGVAFANGESRSGFFGAAIPAGDYWIALRVSGATALGFGNSGQTGRRCVRSVTLPNFNDAWPATFEPAGNTSSCGTVQLLNIWTRTYHQ
jgi:hypothetical protein